MKTCCPNCLTIFRVTTEHLKVRQGNVRCGQCKTVFNALDSLIDENNTPILSTPLEQEDEILEASENGDFMSEESSKDEEHSANGEDKSADDNIRSTDDISETLEAGEPPQDHQEETPEPEDSPGSSPVFPPSDTPLRVPDMFNYMEKPTLSPRARTLYLVAIVAMVITLMVQLTFYLRSEIANAKPQLRPYLQQLSILAGEKLAFPRHAQLISIEASDLHLAPSGGGQLILSATLRNRASYAQELPAIELSLTDVQESVIARRVLMPNDYLPPDMSTRHLFDANTDIPIQLWIETKGLEPVGYRLYIFYS